MTRNTTNLVTGILAHVDAGKTTLAESILYETGQIRKPGRVDHKDAFLDTYELERERGITILSKQAQIAFVDREGREHSMTLLDTPGHVDFSAEMERTLQVLDYAILVINGADGVQSHVQTLWRLLARYRVPVFLFVNKMDQPGTEKEALLFELKERLDERCVDFSPLSGENPEGKPEELHAFYENAAMCSERLLNTFLEQDRLGREELAEAVRVRELFPCCFGSALKMEGVAEFLDVFFRYVKLPEYGNEFGARVYKIGRDKQGKRLTYLKVTGGSLKARMTISGGNARKQERMEDASDSIRQEGWQEKADQIRIYSGSQFTPVQEAFAGSICAVTGLTQTRCGEGLGAEPDAALPVLEPVMTYQVLLPPGCDAYRTYCLLKEFMEEEPELHMVWKETLGEIHVQVMGEVQMEILKSMVQERFGISVEFGAGSIVYKETIRTASEGVGHFEPLRHYAEVHLLLEPGEAGSGLQFDTACSTDMLAKNWQRLILTHLEEKQHKGVLTGSEITDMKVTLISGRAHVKHTEGGDFRQATYRALRQGLRMAESVLLEPVYEFVLEVPASLIGRALSDMERMHARFEPPRTEGERSILCGFVPASTVQGYPTELAAYSGGRGQLSCTLSGYEPCHNAKQVMEAIGYDPEADPDNPTGSVFCAHGAGFVVNWDKVYDYCHIKPEHPENPAALAEQSGSLGMPGSKKAKERPVTEEELREIFERTYKTGGEERGRYKKSHNAGTCGSGLSGSSVSGGTERAKSLPVTGIKKKAEEEYLLVDGYNIIFSWDELRELAKVNVESARTKLMDILCNYQGYKGCTLILVFDAYRVEGGTGGVMQYHNIHVVYTKEAETADQYIEKTVHRIGRKHRVTVATSDALEQIIIWGQGATRLSAQGLWEELESARQELQKEHLEKPQNDRNYLFDHLPDELTGRMEEVRLGKQEF